MENYRLSIKSIHNINKKVLFCICEKASSVSVIYLFHFFVFGRKGGGVENEMMAMWSCTTNIIHTMHIVKI